MGGVGDDLRRGQLHWAFLDPVVGSEQAGRRPVIIVPGPDLLVGSTVVCVPGTLSIPDVLPAFAVSLPATRSGLARDSVAMCHQVRVLSLMRLRRQIGQLSAEDMRAIDAALLYALGLEDAA